jgi:hypothetical protein
MTKERAAEGVPILLIGNKSDLPRVVPREMAERMAVTCSMNYIETSAKSSDNVGKVFYDLCSKIMERKEGRSEPRSRQLEPLSQTRPWSWASC